jgi:hypothetical protein
MSPAGSERVLRRASKEMILSGPEFMEKKAIWIPRAREYRHKN